MDTELSIKLNNTLNGTSLKAIQDKNGNDIVETYIKKEHYSSIDIGMIMYFAGNETIPVGFLLCNGASVRRDTYPDLFNIIGTRWGSVDNEHFNLPNLIGKFAEGSINAGGYKEAGLPNISGYINQILSVTNNVTTEGAMYSGSTPIASSSKGTNAGNYVHTVALNATKSSPIYGKSSTVQPNSALLVPYIKAFNSVFASSTDLEITKVANDIADKANRNLSNLSEQGKKAFFPSGTYVNITDFEQNSIDWSSKKYTPPTNGYVYITGAKGSLSQIYGINIVGSISSEDARIQSDVGHAITAWTVVTKGVEINIRVKNMTGISARFIYAQGEVPV